MDLSIIIPTFNRAETLRECLARLLDSAEGTSHEIIVVDDGSADHTRTVVEEAQQNQPQIKYIFQENAGQGIARNKGISESEGHVVMFIGDDMLATSDLIKEHLSSHEANPSMQHACLGAVDWDPEHEITTAMKWSTNEHKFLNRFGGHQFAFDKLSTGTKPDYNFFYTSNISLKKDMLGEDGFDPEFKGYGWEDIELGYRLQKKGMQLEFNPKAVVHHRHRITLEDLKKRMEKIGSAVHIFNRKHPELKKVPGIGKQIIFRILSNPISLAILRTLDVLSLHILRPVYLYALSKKHFLIGLKNKIS